MKTLINLFSAVLIGSTPIVALSSSIKNNHSVTFVQTANLYNGSLKSLGLTLEEIKDVRLVAINFPSQSEDFSLAFQNNLKQVFVYESNHWAFHFDKLNLNLVPTWLLPNLKEYLAIIYNGAVAGILDDYKYSLDSLNNQKDLRGGSILSTLNEANEVMKDINKNFNADAFFNPTVSYDTYGPSAWYKVWEWGGVLKFNHDSVSLFKSCLQFLEELELVLDTGIDLFSIMKNLSDIILEVHKVLNLDLSKDYNAFTKLQTTLKYENLTVKEFLELAHQDINALKQLGFKFDSGRLQVIQTMVDSLELVLNPDTELAKSSFNPVKEDSALFTLLNALNPVLRTESESLIKLFGGNETQTLFSEFQTIGNQIDATKTEMNLQIDYLETVNFLGSFNDLINDILSNIFSRTIINLLRLVFDVAIKPIANSLIASDNGNGVQIKFSQFIIPLGFESL